MSDMFASDENNPPSCHTINHKDCPPCIELRRMAKRDKSMASLGLKSAGEILLSQKKWKRKKPKTIVCYELYLKALIAFFGAGMRLEDFHPGSILAYQEHRGKTCGPSIINHEINTLAQLLRKADLWKDIRDFYSPLPEPTWKKPEVLTFSEQQRVFDFAKDDPALELAHIVFTISRWTSATGSELRLARISQIDMNRRPWVFHVTADTTKNLIRPRKIPLLPEPEAAFRQALARAAKLGSFMPQHYVFPFTVSRSEWDPNRPASENWLLKQTKILRERTGITKLRPHGWRDQLCTEMLEQGARREDLLPIFGWVSERMIETYEHTRMDAKMNTLKRFAKMEPEGIKSSNIVAFPHRK